MITPRQRVHDPQRPDHPRFSRCFQPGRVVSHPPGPIGRGWTPDFTRAARFSHASITEGGKGQKFAAKHPPKPPDHPRMADFQPHHSIFNRNTRPPANIPPKSLDYPHRPTMPPASGHPISQWTGIGRPSADDRAGGWPGGGEAQPYLRVFIITLPLARGAKPPGWPHSQRESGGPEWGSFLTTDHC